MNIEILKSIGLTQGESQIYMALLKLGSTSSGAIINESRVSRSKVYEVLERLKQKGLATEVVKENVKYFEATSPSRIIEYLKYQEKEVRDKIITAKKLLPQLKKLQSLHTEKQEAKIYTGIEGWKTLYNEILESLTQKDEYLAFGIGKEEMGNEQVKLFIRKFHLKRAEKKIPARVIMQSSTKIGMSYFLDIPYYQFRFTDIKFPTNIAVYNDNVVTLVWGENPVAFVIKSRQVTEKYRLYFDELWRLAKK